MLARLGLVLYWLGCGIGSLCFLLAITVPPLTGMPASQTGVFFAMMIITAVVSWVAARTFRFVLAGF
jgi:hypothetical protein